MSMLDINSLISGASSCKPVPADTLTADAVCIEGLTVAQAKAFIRVCDRYFAHKRVGISNYAEDHFCIVLPASNTTKSLLFAARAICESFLTQDNNLPGATVSKIVSAVDNFIKSDSRVMECECAVDLLRTYINLAASVLDDARINSLVLSALATRATDTNRAELAECATAGISKDAIDGIMHLASTLDVDLEVFHFNIQALWDSAVSYRYMPFTGSFIREPLRDSVARNRARYDVLVCKHTDLRDFIVCRLAEITSQKFGDARIAHKLRTKDYLWEYLDVMEVEMEINKKISASGSLQDNMPDIELEVATDPDDNEDTSLSDNKPAKKHIKGRTKAALAKKTASQEAKKTHAKSAKKDDPGGR